MGIRLTIAPDKDQARKCFHQGSHRLERYQIYLLKFPLDGRLVFQLYVGKSRPEILSTLCFLTFQFYF